MSVGAINTIYLAAHTGPLPAAVAGLSNEWSRLTSDAVYRVRSIRLVRSALRWAWQGATGRRRDPVAVRGLTDTQPLREFLTRCVDVRGIGANIANRRLRAVALSATSYTTGRSVTFVQGATDTPVWERVQRSAVRTQLMLDHVMASAALLLHPTRDLGDLAAGQGRLLPPAVRRVIRAVGGQRDAAAEFLSFLLFHPAHTSRLVDVGYEDVKTQWPAIERFFEKLERAAQTDRKSVV